MKNATYDEVAKLRAKLIEQLEAAQAAADQLNEGSAGHLIECALDELRAIQWLANVALPLPKRNRL
jgi:aryl carrier-like protein